MALGKLTPMPNGILNIHKPAAMTSHDVVGRVRRILKEKRVGHAGTLDPDATGVLVVAVGSATRLLPHLPTEPKVYRAELSFGVATTTEDASGEIVEEADASGLTQAQLDAVLPQFLGQIQQVPPMYSAVHHEGKRLYDLARQGIVVEREARTVMIHGLERGDFQAGNPAIATLTISCGGGTYIRTLCVDIGKAVGLPAHMKTLVRTSVGPYSLAGSVDLEDCTRESLTLALLPGERALNFPSVVLNEEEANLISHGIPLTKSLSGLEHNSEHNTQIMLLYQERLLALAHYDSEAGKIKPFKVFQNS